MEKFPIVGPLIYGPKVRTISLIVAAVVLVLLVISGFIASLSIYTPILLWVFVFLLSLASFSRISTDIRRDRVSRYHAYIYSFVITIGTLLAFSLTSIVFTSAIETNVGTLVLLFALLANTLFLITQYIFYWKVTPNEKDALGAGWNEGDPVLYLVSFVSIAAVGLITLALLLIG